MMFYVLHSKVERDDGVNIVGEKVSCVIFLIFDTEGAWNTSINDHFNF